MLGTQHEGRGANRALFLLSKARVENFTLFGKPSLLCSQSDRGRTAAQYVAKGQERTHSLQQAESYSITSSA
jgi:hypothetical protein